MIFLNDHTFSALLLYLKGPPLCFCISEFGIIAPFAQIVCPPKVFLLGLRKLIQHVMPTIHTLIPDNMADGMKETAGFNVFYEVMDYKIRRSAQVETYSVGWTPFRTACPACVPASSSKINTTISSTLLFIITVEPETVICMLSKWQIYFLG